ncbi:MAG: hypothetical protein VW715_15765 [Rhodospirillales bacterium]|jgi:hypothetical protein
MFEDVDQATLDAEFEDKEYFTTITATVKITVRSDEPLSAADVDEFLSETPYEFGDEYGLTVTGGGTCHIAATEWTDNNIVDMNKEDV